MELSAGFKFGAGWWTVFAGCLVLACVSTTTAEQSGAMTDAATEPSNGDDDARNASSDVADAPAAASPDAQFTCPVDCSHLPHVRAGAVTSCGLDAGFYDPKYVTCQFQPSDCEEGFAHCTQNPNDGCETDLSSPQNCGCAWHCTAPDLCLPMVPFYVVGFRCAPPCAAGQIRCDPARDCVDLQSDVLHCGDCKNPCNIPGAVSQCVQGQCIQVGCAAGSLDCTSAPGCESQLGTALTCAGCADPSCEISNAMLTCSSANSCASAVCLAGFGNCDTTSPDCEATFAGGGICLPGYVGTTALPVQPMPVTNASNAPIVVAADGSFFVGGEYSGSVDFDPTAGEDIRASSDVNDFDGFITKINADGSYAWTKTFEGSGDMSIKGLALSSDGAIVAVGDYVDTVDLDPGTGVDSHHTADARQQAVLVVKLAADGSFVWGKTFDGADGESYAGQVAVDGADAVYVAGTFFLTVDFDPGPGTATRTSATADGMVVKLTAGGDYAWVRTVDNGCQTTLSSVAVGTDGAVWGVGSAYGQAGCPLGAPTAIGALIVSYSSAGTIGGSWLLGGEPWGFGYGVAAGPNGSVYIGGQASGLVDFDPGPAVANRWVDSASGFILKLGPDASYIWAQMVQDQPITAVAGTSDGGVLAVGGSGEVFVTRLGADGRSFWSFLSGDTETRQNIPMAVAARGSTFAVSAFGTGDADPGAGIDVVSGSGLYVSLFTF